jgi:hypothetical protein
MEFLPTSPTKVKKHDKLSAHVKKGIVFFSDEDEDSDKDEEGAEETVAEGVEDGQCRYR